MYSIDSLNFSMMRFYFPDNTPVMIGLTAASPDGDGFEALFENFEVSYLTDTGRENWLKNN